MATRFPYRETIFGLEDSIVSTLGVVVGIAAGTDSRYVVVLSAIIIVVVESLSMTAGTYLSNKSEMEINHTRADIVRRSLTDSLSMAVSYVLGGVISVLPFFFFLLINAIVPGHSPFGCPALLDWLHQRQNGQDQSGQERPRDEPRLSFRRFARLFDWYLCPRQLNETMIKRLVSYSIIGFLFSWFLFTTTTPLPRSGCGKRVRLNFPSN